ncbi:6018_t:CDS:1, partial [Cetraspora pellucida]
YSKKAKKGNSDGWLIQNDSKELANIKEVILNIGIKVKRMVLKHLNSVEED